MVLTTSFRPRVWSSLLRQSQCAVGICDDSRARQLDAFGDGSRRDRRGSSSHAKSSRGTEALNRLVYRIGEFLPSTYALQNSLRLIHIFQVFEVLQDRPTRLKRFRASGALSQPFKPLFDGLGHTDRKHIGLATRG